MRLADGCKILGFKLEEVGQVSRCRILNTVDVIGVDGFRLLSKIEAGTNLKDATVEDDKVFVGALGNYYDVPAGVWCIDPSSGKAVEVKGAGYSILTSGDDKVYSLSVDYSESKAHALFDRPGPERHQARHQTIFSFYSLRTRGG